MWERLLIFIGFWILISFLLAACYSAYRNAVENAKLEAQVRECLVLLEKFIEEAPTPTEQRLLSDMRKIEAHLEQTLATHETSPLN
jgi:Tfp pilus assembly protein PilE